LKALQEEDTEKTEVDVYNEIIMEMLGYLPRVRTRGYKSGALKFERKLNELGSALEKQQKLLQYLQNSAHFKQLHTKRIRQDTADTKNCIDLLMVQMIHTKQLTTLCRKGKQRAHVVDVVHQHVQTERTAVPPKAPAKGEECKSSLVSVVDAAQKAVDVNCNKPPVEYSNKTVEGVDDENINMSARKRLKKDKSVIDLSLDSSSTDTEITVEPNASSSDSTGKRTSDSDSFHTPASGSLDDSDSFHTPASGSLDDSDSFDQKHVLKEESEESLREMIVEFIEQTLRHAEGILSTLVNVRDGARQELADIAEREDRVRIVASKAKAYIRTLDEALVEDFPIVEVDEETLTLKLGRDLDHQCHYCLCRNRAVEVDMDVSKAAKQLGITLAHCRKYTNFVVEIKQRLNSVSQTVSKAYDVMCKNLRQLLWSKLGTSIFQKDANTLRPFDDFDLEDIDIKKIRESMKYLSWLSPEMLLLKARNLVIHVDRLTKQVMVVAKDANVRMTDIKDQMAFLSQLDQVFERADVLISRTVLSLARARANSNFLRKGKRCYHCHISHP
jgi:hypothetical protein